MNYLGISAGFHDAAISVIDDNGNILFAGHSERYSKQKHDYTLDRDLINDAHKYVGPEYEVHYYERPYIKAIRQLLAGQPIGPLSVDGVVGKPIDWLDRRKGKVKTHNHHLCHAAAGFQTSPFEDATVVVIDAIGELDTISIWDASYDKNGVAKYKKIWGRKYPDSIGLFYSAMTRRVNLRPLDEEYILMGMAAYGEPKYEANMHGLFNSIDEIILKDNLHIGVDKTFLKDADEMDIAASAQKVVEQLIEAVMQKARKLGKSRNLVYGGGVALNCLANRLIGKYFNNIWIMPNPGDAGNSLGAAALGYGKKVNWNNAFLGFDIKGDYPVDNILKELYSNKIVGVANGRAEFGA
jgi:carbamoyltransferase